MLDRLRSVLPDLRLLRALVTGGACVTLAACGAPASTPPMMTADAGVTILDDGGATLETDGGPIASAAGVTVRARPVVLTPGGSAELWISLQRTPGFEDPLAVVIEGLPEGVTASGPAGITGEQASFVLQAEPVVASGEHPIVVRVSAGDVSGEAESYVAIPGAAGTPDDSFAGAIAPGADGIQDVRLLPDGRIVAVWSIAGTQPTIAFARWDHDGALDPSFDGDGVATVTLDAPTDVGVSDVNGLVVRADGTAIGIIDARVGDGPFRAWLVAVSPTGALEPSFGEGGVLELPAGETADLALGGDRLFTLQSELVEGQPGARLRAYDATAPGAPEIDTAVAFAARDIEIDASRRALVLGRTGQVGALMRLTPEGTIDTSFHGNGMATFGALDATYPYSLAVRDDGSILVVGSSDGSGTRHPFAAMIDDHGDLVTSFGALSGRMVVEGSVGTFADVTVAPDGALVATGSDGTGAMTLMRILPGGVLAPEMGPMGIRTDAEARYGGHIVATPDRRVVVMAAINGGDAPLRFWY